MILILLTYLRLINHAPIDSALLNEPPTIKQGQETFLDKPQLIKCNFDETEALLRYKSPKTSINDTRPRPTIERLYKLFQILISYEDKFRDAFNYLEIFRFTDLHNTLHPFVNDTQRLYKIYCLLQRYITISDNGHIDITPSFISYLSQVSSYLADGFDNQHVSWNKTSINDLTKPVIILASNTHFYNMLQASMRTIDKFLKDHKVVIYDLGFNPNEVNMVS